MVDATLLAPVNALVPQAKIHGGHQAIVAIRGV